MDCYICGKKMNKGKIKFRGVLLSGWKCPCGEEIMPSSEVVRYEIMKGRRKSDVRTVTKMGNSLVVSIPHDYASELHIKRGSRLMVLREQAGLKLLPF
ncbi:MAG: hypothetical protein V1911_01545 [Candidatus Micrarchaeota archaeon]